VILSLVDKQWTRAQSIGSDYNLFNKSTDYFIEYKRSNPSREVHAADKVRAMPTNLFLSSTNKKRFAAAGGRRQPARGTSSNNVYF
jgi:hypothetical protein